MPNLLSLEFLQKQKQQQKQTQRIMMSPQMQQALYFLQLPILELSIAIEQEMMRNPLLDYISETAGESEEESDLDIDPEKEIIFDEKNFELLRKIDEELKEYFSETSPPLIERGKEEEKKKNFLESLIPERISLFDQLLKQVKEIVEDKTLLPAIEILIGSLDERGYLGTPLKELSLFYSFTLEELKKGLKIVQSLEPWGIGARNTQECFLIQLSRKRKKNSMAYRIISDCYDLFIHHRYKQIQKKLKRPLKEIVFAIEKDISRLQIHPGSAFSLYPPQYIIPDASLIEDEDSLIIEINEERLPPLKLNSRYLNLLKKPSLSAEAKSFIEQKTLSAKWLIRNIRQRNETLYRIIQFLAEKQKQFFKNPQGKLIPLTMQTVAKELNLHESTVARAVANKYLHSLRGTLPLRSFFSNAYLTEHGEDVSSKTVREMLLGLIKKENKLKPLSDEKLSQLLKAKGIPCARRTVTKYRRILRIGSSTQRRKLG